MTDSFNRREFVGNAARGGLVFGTGFVSMADFARAASTPDDEHFYIFVELRGGVQWMIGTDGRDLSRLPLDNPRFCETLKITDTPLTTEEYARIVQGEGYRKQFANGKFILLPYLDDLTASYKKGKTTLGNDYILGFAGLGLEPYVDDVAVLRGVHVQGDFHGIANAGGEIFSGLNSGEMPHLASVMAGVLTQKLGAKLLDNLVFENATFTSGSAALAKAPVRLDAQSLGLLVGNADNVDAEAGAQRFAKARQLAEALAAAPGLSDLHREVFKQYIGAMTGAPTIRNMLLKLRDDLTEGDASLDLKVQLQTATTLLQAGLARVVTLCLGAPNGRNKVDGFGLFDAHTGVYHLSGANTSTFNTQRHHLNVKKTLDVLGDFIKTLKATKFGATQKSLFDVTTVVVGTEFSRPSNFMGNEAGGGQGNTAFGSGHYNYNNNYILFGKGVRGGAWLGKNDDITQMGHQVDLTSVDSDDCNAVRTSPVAMAFTPQTPGASEADGVGIFQPKDLDYGAETRPFMAKDLVRTVLATAGADTRYGEAFTDDRIKNAKTLRPLIKT